MSTRLPVVSARPPAALRAEPLARGPRVDVARTLLCVVGTGASADAAPVRVARALIAQLASRGRPVAALVTRADNGGDGGLAALREAGAQPAIALASAQLPEAARAALDALHPEAIAVGVGAELAARLRPALTIQVGRAGPEAAACDADLELRADAEAVASEIGAWLARR